MDRRPLSASGLSSIERERLSRLCELNAAPRSAIEELRAHARAQLERLAERRQHRVEILLKVLDGSAESTARLAIEAPSERLEALAAEFIELFQRELAADQRPRSGSEVIEP